MSNKPIVILSQDFTKDSSQIVLWNSGPGTAYNITVENHLVKVSEGNVGNPFVTEVIKSAIELETKSRQELNYYLNSYSNIRLINNHPPILPFGIENGYKTSYYKRFTLLGISSLIKYQDAIGNKYFSLWNGFKWQIGKDTSTIQPYCNINQEYVLGYKGRIDHDLTGYNKALTHFEKWKKEVQDLPYNEWLCKEALYLNKKGLGDVPEVFKSFVGRRDTINVN
ncbi:MAG: hypothetical protein IPH20_15845 [Bacteroidales bacterium]|nr:hypothetical protein [Bacteroidales bacterium]